LYDYGKKSIMPLNNVYQGGSFICQEQFNGSAGRTSIKATCNIPKLTSNFEKRGLIIDDEDLAIRALQRINYYRLSAYGLSLKRNDQSFEGVTFSQIHALYEFNHRFIKLPPIGCM